MTEIKNYFRDYPAFAWSAVIVFIFIVLYVINKQQNAQAGSTTAAQGDIPTYILYDATQQSTPGTTGSPNSGGSTQTAKIRNKTPVDSAGGKQTSVPVFADAKSGTKSSFTIPFGSTVNVTGPSVSGRTQHSQNGKFSSSTWWPISYNGKNGFVVDYDIIMGTTNNSAINETSFVPPQG